MRTGKYETQAPGIEAVEPHADVLPHVVGEHLEELSRDDHFPNGARARTDDGFEDSLLTLTNEEAKPNRDEVAALAEFLQSHTERIDDLVAAAADRPSARSNLTLAFISHDPRSRLSAALLEQALRDQWFPASVVIGPTPRSVPQSADFENYVARLTEESRTRQVHWFVHALGAESESIQRQLHSSVDATAKDQEVLRNFSQQDDPRSISTESSSVYETTRSATTAARLALSQIDQLKRALGSETSYGNANPLTSDSIQWVDDRAVRRELGPSASHELPNLVQLLNYGNKYERIMAASAIAQIDPHAYGATVVLPDKMMPWDLVEQDLLQPSVDEGLPTCALRAQVTCAWEPACRDATEETMRMCLLEI